MSNNFPAIRKQLTSPNIKSMVEARIGQKAGTFITSVLDLIGNDKHLMQCDPNIVMKEAMKAAGLDLPISKTLGFAYVIPYKGMPQFQMGYKGYIQLAIRTGQYKHLNAGEVYEGESLDVDRIKGTLSIGGKKTGEKVIGYFAYMELINGFEKAVAWTREQVETHASRFSKSYGGKYDSPWKSDFDAMAKKTMLLQLIPKYGPMNIEMGKAIENDRGDTKHFNDENVIEITPESQDLTSALSSPVGAVDEFGDPIKKADTPAFDLYAEIKAYPPEKIKEATAALGMANFTKGMAVEGQQRVLDWLVNNAG